MVHLHHPKAHPPAKGAAQGPGCAPAQLHSRTMKPALARNRGHIHAALAALLLICPAATAASDTDWEVFLGFSGISSLMNRTYDAPYTPSKVGSISQLFEIPDSRSRARQSVAMQGDKGSGIGFGLAVYPHRTFGLELLVDRSGADLSGGNAPHTVDLVWDSISFPSSDPVVRRGSFSFDAPATAARLRMLTMSLNLAARWKTGERLSGSASIGASYFRLHAEELQLGAMAGWLGGHAVLFSQLVETSASTATESALGFNVGVDVAVDLGSGLSLFADGRLFLAPDVSAIPRLDRFIDDTSMGIPITQVERSLALPPVTLDPRHLRVLVGIKWRP